MICLFWFAFPVFADDLPDGPGKDLVTKACTGCHGASNFSSKTNTKEDWKAVVDTMIGYGAEATPEQAEIIVTYLTKNLGKTLRWPKNPEEGGQVSQRLAGSSIRILLASAPAPRYLR